MKVNVDIADINLLNFLEEFSDSDYDITIEYYWDNSPRIIDLKKKGLDPFEINIKAEELDEEYSFHGKYKEFIEHANIVGCYDSLNLYDATIVIVDTEEEKIYIKLLITEYVEDVDDNFE